VAQFHRKAIEHVGGELLDRHILDPKYMGCSSNTIESFLYSKAGVCYIDHNALWTTTGAPPSGFDYIVICSPSHLHYEQIKTILLNHPYRTQIIVEKPLCLPWEPMANLDDNRINISLQLRYLPDFPKKAELVYCQMVRDEEYFKTWKGDARKTGGLFFNLFIHYIDLAIQLDARFEGRITDSGDQARWIGTNWSWPKEVWSDDDRFFADGDRINISDANMQTCYNRMYEDILSGGGIKPKDLHYLNWILQRNSEIFGYGRAGLNKTIGIPKELL